MPEPTSDQGKEVAVPEGIRMNLTARDLRPHLSSDAEELVTDELIGPQHYQMGVAPKHVSRAAGDAATGGIGTMLFGAGSALSSAYEMGMDALTAPARPDRLSSRYKDIKDLLATARRKDLPRKKTEEALTEAGSEMGTLAHMAGHAVAPAFDLYKEYKHPESQAAETAAKRIAKAKRKRERRTREDSLGASSALYDRLVRPMKENARISRSVRNQMDKGGPIQLNAPPENTSN